MRMLALSAVLFAGCDPADPEEESIFLANENNYSWSGGLEIPTIQTAELADLKIDWSGLTTDMLCHDMDPVTSVDNLGLTRFPNLSPDEVASGLTNNSLLQSDTSGYVSVEPGDATSALLSEFSFGGTPYDTVSVFRQSGGTFLLVVAVGFDPGQGALSLVFLEPSPASSVTEITVEPTCDIVNYDIEFETLTPLSLPAAGPWTIDWSSVSIAGNGVPVVPAKLDQVLVARYEETPAELEGKFLDIELIAKELYTLELTGGTEADLSGLVSKSGESFGGFTGEGTWILALRCTSCTNPAPIFLTTVTPEG